MSDDRRTARPRGPMGHGRDMAGGEKARDFGGTLKKLFRYMEKYKIRFLIMIIFAVAGTVFNIAGPKILGKATSVSHFVALEVF